MQQGIFDLLLAGEEREDGTSCGKEGGLVITCLTFRGDFPGTFVAVQRWRSDRARERTGAGGQEAGLVGPAALSPALRP